MGDSLAAFGRSGAGNSLAQTILGLRQEARLQRQDESTAALNTQRGALIDEQAALTGAQVKGVELETAALENKARLAKEQETQFNKPVMLSTVRQMFPSEASYDHALNRAKSMGMVNKDESGLEYVKAGHSTAILQSLNNKHDISKMAAMNIQSLENQIKAIDTTLTEENAKPSPNEKTIESLTKQKQALGVAQSGSIARRDSALESLAVAEVNAAAKKVTAEDTSQTGKFKDWMQGRDFANLDTDISDIEGFFRKGGQSQQDRYDGWKATFKNATGRFPTLEEIKKKLVNDPFDILGPSEEGQKELTPEDMDRILEEAGGDTTRALEIAREQNFKIPGE